MPIALALTLTSRAFFQALAPVCEFARVVAPSAGSHGKLSLERRLSFLRQHGSFTLAYSAAVQRGLEYFGDENGFIAYRTVSGTAMVLADPVAAVADRAKLIREFLAVKSKVCFCQVSRPTAEILAAMGFLVNEMGTDIRIDLPGYKRKSLRHDFNRVTRAGTVIKEGSAAEIGIDAIREVSDRWRRMRTFKEREVTFLNRPIVLEDEPDVRKFFAFDRDGKLVGFAYYDPIYEDGQVVGYSTSFKRRLPEADTNICNALLHVAMEAFRAEGRKYLYLGLSPMADIEDKDFRHSRVLNKVFRASFTNPLFNRYVYPIKGHASHKGSYRGTAEQTYFAFRSGFSLPNVEKMVRACFRV